MDRSPTARGPLRGSRATDAEAALLARLAARDEAALVALYERAAPAVYACCLRILRDPDDAKDATSQAFWRIWSRAGDYDAEQGSALAWLLTIARRLALDQRRSGVRRGRTLARLESELPERPDSSREAMERVAVATALARLSDRDRALLESAYFEGLSGSDIALRDDLPLGTVKSRMRAALRRLRIALHGGPR
jgi:RNA polymerase sigma-70 factor (ECF subfamily)